MRKSHKNISGFNIKNYQNSTDNMNQELQGKKRNDPFHTKRCSVSQIISNQGHGESHRHSMKPFYPLQVRKNIETPDNIHSHPELVGGVVRIFRLEQPQPLYKAVRSQCL